MKEAMHQSGAIERKLKQALFSTIQNQPPYPGYPETRLTHSHPEVARQLTERGVITALPDGPWDAGTDKLQSTLSPEDVRLLQLEGYSFDELSRPLHPWLSDMLQYDHVGVVTGTGAYWNMGPNKTADPIIVAREGDAAYVFLVQRNDNGLWALPGGFVDPGEQAAEAACREAFEEGGVVLTQAGATIYKGVVADMRTTAHAWAETTAILFEVNERQTPTIDVSEVSDARWFCLEDLPKNLHGSHSILLQEALKL